MSYKSDVSKADRTAEVADFPAVILIDNCSACNLRCSMCDHKNIKNYRNIQIMGVEIYKKLIDEIAQEKPDSRVWEIFFGDPCLCPDMPKRIAYAKQAGLKDVVLNTNGVLMTPNKSEAFIRAGLDAMYVGVDAATEETYNQIRFGGNFTKVVENILHYKDLLLKYGNGKQQLFVQFVVSDINEHELNVFKTFWSKRGIKLKVRPKVSWAGLVEADNLRSNAEVERKPCYWMMRTLSICADGRVALCAVDVHCRVPCGNAHEKSLKKLWQGRLKEFRDMHRDGRWAELPQLCRSCMDWQSGYAEFIDTLQDSTVFGA
ncbi:MAG: radical SAM protein [Desulfobacteraceae bacterium]|nr:radical SAM protein [Desulfobacteraceae bacterium]